MSAIEPTSRRSLNYFPSREGTIPGGHAFLLARDIPSAIMPIRGSRTNPEFGVELAPSGKEDWLVQFLDVERYGRESLEETIVQFVEVAADYIGHYGDFFQEILFSDSEPSKLVRLPPGRMVSVPRSVLQIVPRADRAELGKSFVSIPRNRIWRISLPHGLGSARSYRRLLRRLAALSDPSMPDFALKDLGHGRSVGYEFSAQHEAAERLMERAMRRLGSVPSLQSPVGDSTEYFYISRRVQFRHSQALLREHIIAELNGLLRRLGISATVVVSGLVTSAQLAETARRLHQGEISFEDTLNATFE